MASGDEARGRRWAWFLGGLSAAVLLAQCTGGANGNRARTAEPIHQLSVAPFHADSAHRNPLARVLAESLAVRLSGLPGLAARAGTGRSNTEFVVRGEIAGRDGRLVIAARLYGGNRDSTLWSATFWRRDSLTTELVGDLAAGLAEAIFGYLARGSGASARGKP